MWRIPPALAARAAAAAAADAAADADIAPAQPLTTEVATIIIDGDAPAPCAERETPTPTLAPVPEVPVVPVADAPSPRQTAAERAVSPPPPPPPPQPLSPIPCVRPPTPPTPSPPTPATQPCRSFAVQCGRAAGTMAARAWLCATRCATGIAARAGECRCGRTRRMFVVFHDTPPDAAFAAIPNVDAFEIGPDRYVCRRVPWFELSAECVRGRSPWHMMQVLLRRIPQLATSRFTLKWKRV